MPVLTQKRAMYEWIMSWNEAAGLGGTELMAGYLRSEVVLTSGGGFNFPILDTETFSNQPVFATEERLNKDDAFWPIFHSVQFYTYATDAEDADLARATSPLHTYASALVFGLNAPSVEGAYNGQLSLRVGQTIYMPGVDIKRFRRADTAQFAVETTTTPSTYQSDYEKGEEAFMLEADPLPRLNGGGKIIYGFSPPKNINLDFTLEADMAVVMVLYLRGWINQGAGATRSINMR